MSVKEQNISDVDVNTNAIVVNDLHKDYDNKTKALRGISLEITMGEFVIIRGESGCGKTTLLNIMSGIDTPTSGTVELREPSGEIHHVNKLKRKDRTNLFTKIGFVFQNATGFLIPFLDAKDNVSKALEAKDINMKRNDIDEASLKALELVGLKDRATHLPFELSGGECQRVAIARAIVREPVVIFADEPTGNLDSKNAKMILDILEDLNKRGRTIVMVTHSNEIDESGKRIINMKDGMII